MKKAISKEELLQKRKIESTAFWVVLCGLAISIVIQRYAFAKPLENYAFESVLFLVGIVYVVVANALKGTDVLRLYTGTVGDIGSHIKTPQGKKAILKESLLGGVVITICDLVFDAGSIIKMSPVLIVTRTLIEFSITTIVIYCFFSVIYNARVKKEAENALKQNDKV